MRTPVSSELTKTKFVRSSGAGCSPLLTLHPKKKHFHPNAAKEDHVFVHEDGVRLNVRNLANQLRTDLQPALKASEIEMRPELLERSAVRQPLRAHDLRATFVTIGLANGKTEAWISDRTGHKTGSGMIDRYRRKARTWSAMKEGELTPLHLAIPELAIHALRSAPGSRHAVAVLADY